MTSPAFTQQVSHAHAPVRTSRTSSGHGRMATFDWTESA